MNNGYYKIMEDGGIVQSLNVYAPEYTLDETTTDESYDGWKWFDTQEEAYSYYAAHAGEVLSVTPRQFRLALLGIGVSPSTITNSLSGDEQALTEWEYATEICSDHPLIQSMAVSMGIDSDGVTAIFESATKL